MTGPGDVSPAVEVDGDAELDAEVVIVGGGPVGCLLAVFLQTYGVSTALIERDAEPYRLPRAIVMDDENQRYFHMLGIAEELSAITTPLRGADFVSVAGERLLGAEIPPVGRLGVPPVLCHFQPDLDALLRATAAQRGSITLLGTTAVGMSATDDSVEVALDDGTVVRGKYAVGCDGASSWTRRTVGLSLDDLGFDQDWVVVDVELREGRGADLPGVLQQVCDPVRPTTYVPGHARYRRWEFQVQPGDDVADLVSEEGMWRLLDGWLTPDDATIVRTAAYRFHAVVAPQMRAGRVFLAGDAAHQMPPFLGQGLNSGMRDAANLAWKLAWVLRGRAGDALLETYSAEREPHVRSVVAHAVDSGRLIDQLAGRESHGVDHSRGYGGARPVPRVIGPLSLGDDDRVGLPCPWIPEIWEPLSGTDPVFVLGVGGVGGVAGVAGVADAGRVADQMRDDPNVRVVTVEASHLDDGHWLLVRPDGIVADAGEGATGAADSWQAIRQIASDQA